MCSKCNNFISYIFIYHLNIYRRNIKYNHEISSAITQEELETGMLTSCSNVFTKQGHTGPSLTFSWCVIGTGSRLVLGPS